jgi:hypothetical protein
MVVIIETAATVAIVTEAAAIRVIPVARDPPGEAEMVSALARIAIVNAYHSLKIRPPRWFGDQARLPAAIFDLEIEVGRRMVGKGFVAFRTIVPSVPSSYGSQVDQVAAHGDFDFVIDL